MTSSYVRIAQIIYNSIKFSQNKSFNQLEFVTEN